MELRHLKYFVAVVERRGFREASRYLHVAQPAISQTLSNLEGEIGGKLFMRLGRSVKLTPEGEIFYAETLRTLEQAQHAVEATQRASRGEIGIVSVGFCGAATYSFLPILVREYQPPPVNPLAQQFFMAVQLLAGLLLLTGFFVPLALALLAAELYNILAFHLTLAPGIAPALVASVLWVLVFLQYRASFKGILARETATEG
jgi:DNA-binding transcriptional LysR family regulator